MTPEDRELLLSLRQQQADLQQSLEALAARLGDLESRLEVEAPAHDLPELPEHHFLPAVPSFLIQDVAPLSVPAPETAAPEVHLPPPPVTTPPAAPVRPPFQFQFGRWLTRIGAVLAVLLLILFDFYLYHEKLLGPWGIFASGGALSFFIIVMGQRLERKEAGLLFFSRTVLAIGLALLYVTLYTGSTVEDLQVVHRPWIGGLLLLAWSAYVLVLAERKQSQTLSLFAIALAYFSSAINPIGALTMSADLLLAGTALVFLLRNGWAALSYVCLIGTYLAPLRRLLTDENGELTFEPSKAVHFAPYAIYLAGAWAIFTACVLLSTSPSFRGGKRLAFLTLNNAGFVGLLLLTAYLAGYGTGEFGRILLGTGAGLLVLAVLSRWTRAGTSVIKAYLSQGVILATAGVIVIFTGVARGVVLALETFFLGAAASVSRNRILEVCALVSAFFTTVFLAWEISFGAHHPWLLGLGGAVIMLFNARWTRGSYLFKVTPASAYYVLLALTLIYCALQVELSDRALPPALALGALALTLTIYVVRIPALPPLVQVFLLLAQGLVLFPAETGESLPWWSPALVAAATLLSVIWWSRQTRISRGWWISVLNCIYALALVGLAHQAVRPHVDMQNWMACAAILSFLFLAFGALARVWTIAAIGQVFLGVSLYHFLFPSGDLEMSGDNPFPWTALSAAVPIAVVYATGRATLNWLRLFPEAAPVSRSYFRLAGYAYLLLALLLSVRLVFAKIPVPEQVGTLLFLSTFLVSWNVHRPSTFGARCGWALGLLACSIYFIEGAAVFPPTLIDALGVACFLSLVGLLNSDPRRPVTTLETLLITCFSVGLGWYFISDWIEVRINPHDLTIGWAFYALLLFLFGILVRDKWLLWSGGLVLAGALAEACVTLFLHFSDGSTVLTFFSLTVITLGLGYIFARFGDRLKSWM